MDLKEEIVAGKTNKLCNDAGTVQLANWKQTINYQDLILFSNGQMLLPSE